MKIVTHCVNYYGQTLRLRDLYAEWEHFPAEFKTMIIDDGHPVEAFMQPTQPTRLARIEVDIPYNFAGTHNLALALCDTEWLLHTDMDTRVTPEAAAKVLSLIAGSGDDDVWFFRLQHEGAEIPTTPGAWLMKKVRAWKLGGFNEDLCGNYGHQDVDFLRRLAPSLEMNFAPFPLEFIPSASVEMSRDTAINSAKYREGANKITFTCTSPLRFPFRVLR